VSEDRDPVGTEEPVRGGSDARLLSALRERVKELTCLYGITQITANAEVETPEAVQRIVELLPPAWQYPEITTARIVLDDGQYVSAGFVAGHRPRQPRHGRPPRHAARRRPGSGAARPT
jgi:hypothetical protein